MMNRVTDAFYCSQGSGICLVALLSAVQQFLFEDCFVLADNEDFSAAVARLVLGVVKDFWEDMKELIRAGVEWG